LGHALDRVAALAKTQTCEASFSTGSRIRRLHCAAAAEVDDEKRLADRRQKDARMAFLAGMACFYDARARRYAPEPEGP
jgi:hypothetical protein